LLTRVC
jgi:hypothetical protein